MVQEIANYEVGKSNAEITSGNSETFFKDQPDTEAKSKYGSFSYLEIVNDSASNIFIDLDGLTNRRRKLFARSTMVIKAEVGIYFDTVKIIEASSGTIAADEIKLIGRILQR